MDFLDHQDLLGKKEIEEMTGWTVWWEDQDRKESQELTVCQDRQGLGEYKARQE